MKEINVLSVLLDGRKIGTLAKYERNLTAFQYEDDWLDKEKGVWKLSPAYDMTYSSGIGGEHATCVNGNGKNPGMEDILAVAESACISSSKAQKIARDVQEITKELQKCFPR